MRRTLATIFVCSLMFVIAGAASAEQEPGTQRLKYSYSDVTTQIVRIQGYEGVQPLNLRIKPGTVVIWLNQFHGKTQVTFPNKQVTLACKSPVNFRLGEDGGYISQPIAFGEVASLCFVEKGTFNYFIVRSPQTSERLKGSDHFRYGGKITVQE